MFLVPGALARGMLVAKPWRTATSSPDRGVPTVKSRAAVAWAAGRPLSIEEVDVAAPKPGEVLVKSEEHTSELQSQSNLVCRLLLEKKKKKEYKYMIVR